VSLAAECDKAFSVSGGLSDGFRFGPGTSTEDFICWSLDRFKGWRMVLTTSFGMEGCALIDMYAHRGVPMEIVYLDTMFFFPETYDLIARMKEKYPHLSFVNKGTALSLQAQAELHGPELWKTNPDLCCKLRKVEPLAKVMRRADVWISALRRSQSVTRERLEMVEWDSRFEVLKLNPLSFWERDEVYSYVKERDVPYNDLHERGYPSIGCTHCTRPVENLAPGEYTRLGRWSGSEKTECGLHLVAG